MERFVSTAGTLQAKRSLVVLEMDISECFSENESKNGHLCLFSHAAFFPLNIYMCILLLLVVCGALVFWSLDAF